MLFLQFIFPNGQRKPNTIDMPSDVEALATELRNAGWSAEIECFPDTQLVNMDICDAEEQLGMELCQNGPEVPVAVEKLVRSAHERWVKMGKPKAYGFATMTSPESL